MLYILALLMSMPLDEVVANKVAERLLEIQGPNPINIEVGPGPLQAVQKVYLDLSNQQEPEFFKYIWIPSKSPDVAAEVNFTVNECISRSDLSVRPVVLHGGEFLRYDLRHLATNLDDLNTLIFLWADIAFDDKYFNIQLAETKILPVKEFWFQGTQYKAKHLRLTQPQHYTEPFGSQILQLSQLQGAIYRADWFIEIANTTLKPGRYYDFVGIEGDNLERFLAKFDLKLADLDLGLKDERAALFKSKPTGKPRLIKVLTSNVARPSKSRGIVAVTYDITDEQFEAINDPIENLIKFDFAAYEIIADRPNGTHIYTIFNKDGILQKEGDPKIAPDHREPEELGSKVLQSGLSCRRCHGYGHGWQHFDNDVYTMLKGEFAVFDDLSSNITRNETLVLLSRLYSSQPSQKPLGVLEIGRQLYSQTVDKITLGRELPFMAETLHNIHVSYKSTLNAADVLEEIGFIAKTPEDALAFINRVFPETLGAQEHPIVGALKAGIPIQRTQFERAYGYMVGKVLQGVKYAD